LLPLTLHVAVEVPEQLQVPLGPRKEAGSGTKSLIPRAEEPGEQRRVCRGQRLGVGPWGLGGWGSHCRRAHGGSVSSRR